MKFISLLSLLLFLTLTAAKLDNRIATTTTNLIPKACEKSSQKALCISVFNSEPTAKTANLKDLAFIALKTTANTAFNTSTHIKSLLEKGSIEQPELDDGLNSCAGSYVDVVDQIDESIDALVTKNFTNVDMWVNAAVADVTTCDGYMKGLSVPVAKELVQKNCFVQDLCKNALEVAHVFANDKSM